MGILTKMLQQTAVYWAPKSTDAFGNETYEDPVQLAVRWVDTNEEVSDPEGRRFTSMAKVYVESDVEVGGVLWEGELGDPDQPSPSDIKHQKIRRFGKTPKLKGPDKGVLRTVWL